MGVSPEIYYPFFRGGMSLDFDAIGALFSAQCPLKTTSLDSSSAFEKAFEDS